VKNEQESILDRISIAAPCNADWDNMVGDERERFCNQCTFNVYNISSMSKAEAEEFLSLRTQGRVCVQFYKRKDGTIITDNCPKGLRVIRDQTRKMIQAASAFLTLLATSNLFAWAQQQSEPVRPMPTRGKVLIRPEAKPEAKPESKPDSKPDTDPSKIMPLRGEVYVPTKKDDAACFAESEKQLKEKLAKLEKSSKDKLAIVRAHLDLASFYRSKNHLEKADGEYAIAIKMLSKMSAEKELYKNSVLNRSAVLKLLGKNKDASELENSLLKSK